MKPMTEFTFRAEDHSYHLDGERIWSITQILGFLSQRSLQDAPDQDVVERARERGVAAHQVPKPIPAPEKSATIPISPRGWRS